MNPGQDKNQRGAALITVLLLAAVLMSMLGVYYTMTHIENASTQSSMNGSRGFYAAEAGLNLRAQEIRQTFIGYNRPTGRTPANASGRECEGGNFGGGDYSCKTYDLQRRSVATFVNEPPGNPRALVVPRGERFQNLQAQEYTYVVSSIAMSPDQRVEALLDMGLKSRLIPLFQFAAFYNKDLEIQPGPPMSLAGPVHTNGDLYLGAGASLDILGQVTTAADLYRGRKDNSDCADGRVGVLDPGVLTDLPACSGGRARVDESSLAPWHGMIATHVDTLTVPEPEELDPTPGATYWDKADVRIVLDTNQNPPRVEVRRRDGSVDFAGTNDLGACGCASHSDSFFNNREGKWIDMLDVDMRSLLDCAHDRGVLTQARTLDDGTEGGLVLYFGVDGPDADAVNHYGVRVHNGAELAATDPMAPEVGGLTVVTNQAIYIQGDYNSTNKKPAAFLADSLNVLSNDWEDGTRPEEVDSDAGGITSISSSGGSAGPDFSARRASATTVNAAFLAGTDSTGRVEGAGGQDLAQYNGGLENYPRFHENWSGVTFTYRGSLISLNTPRHVDGQWVYGGPYYTAPNRDWNYDTDFNDAANLPPLTPRFVYLKQELFVRQFE